MTRLFVSRLACLAFGAMLLAAGPADAAPSALVHVTRLEKGSLPRIVTTYGSVQASSSAQRTVMAPLSGVVDRVYVRQGQDVAKRAPLIRLVPSPKTSASYAQAKSALGVARQLVARTRRMVGQHLATAQQLAEAEKSESDARAALAALDAQGANGPNILRAPFAAIVTGLSTSPGTIVVEGSALLSLARPKGLVLEVGVVPPQAAAIAPGDQVRITPIGERESVEGKVLQRGAVVDAGDGLVPVEIAFPAGKFLPGEMAEAVITTGEVQGFVVPHAAILVNDSGRPYVVQAVQMVARKVAVQILAADGDKDVIKGPLDATAPLVLAGNYQLENGMRVRIANPAGKAAP